MKHPQWFVGLISFDLPLTVHHGRTCTSSRVHTYCVFLKTPSYSENSQLMFPAVASHWAFSTSHHSFLGSCMWVYMLLACTPRLVHFLTVVIFKHTLVFRLTGATENTMTTRMVFIWKQSIPCASLALRYQSVLVQQYNAQLLPFW